MQSLVESYDDLLSNAYDLNDSMDLTEEKRIKELTKLGKRMGVTFTFV